MASVILRNLTKSFDGAARPALRELSLEVREGEFLVLLGPSGGGKTTALRCIAGLDEATEVEIHFGERDVTRLPPAERDVAMVFQNYALYPHLTVRENIAFALEVRRVPRKEILRRVSEAAQRLGLAELLERRPAQLSGRQRQRVAFGRVIECGSLTVPVALEHYEGEIELGVRPEHVTLSPPEKGLGSAEILIVEPHGPETLVHLDAGGQTLVARLPGLLEVRVGDRVGVKLDKRHFHFFDASGAPLP